MPPSVSLRLREGTELARIGAGLGVDKNIVFFAVDAAFSRAPLAFDAWQVAVANGAHARRLSCLDPMQGLKRSGDGLVLSMPFSL